MHARRQLAAFEARSAVKPVTSVTGATDDRSRERSHLSPRAALTAYNHCASCLSHLVDSHGHEAIVSMDYDSTNNVFFRYK